MNCAEINRHPVPPKDLVSGSSIITAAASTGCSALREGPPPVDVAGHDEEQVRDPIDDPDGVGVPFCVPGGDQAAFGAAHDRAGDVEERPELALAGDYELLGDLRLPAPLLEGGIDEGRSSSAT